MWRALSPSFDLDLLERGTFEVLPLVYRSLVRAGVDDPDLPRLKGIYRKSWVTGSLLAERTAEAARALGGTEIPALFVEGVVLAQRFYPELGLRPTASIDVLVRHGDRARASAALARAGWSADASPPGEHAPVAYLSDARGNVLVLRTRLAVDFVAPGMDAEALLWSAAETWPLGTVEVLVPSPTDTLLAVCASRARLEGARQTQWIADAALLLSSRIDWQRLTAAGVEFGQAQRLRDVFEYLGTLPITEVPQEVSRALEAARPTYRERLSYTCTTRRSPRLGSFPSLIAEHLAATTGEPWLRTVGSFPRRLRDHWHLSSSWLVPLAAARRAGGLLVRGSSRAA